jgi:hypothetical protein
VDLNALLFEMIEKAKWKQQQAQKKQAELDTAFDELLHRKV